MKETIETLEDLFENATKLKIPSYQRAYAWEEEQLNQFVSDMLEMKDEYYYGHFIVENTDDGFEIIDGQQRLTTFILFLLVCRLFQTEKFENYINKFETVDYDNEAFKTIQKGLYDINIEWKMEDFKLDEPTLSIQRILFALNHFRKLFKDEKLNYTEIGTYVETLTKAHVSSHIAETKAVAVQIFELQNTRGIKLNLIEKVKSKLMKAIYLNAELKRDEKVSAIQNNFAEIYRLEESVSSNSFRGELKLDDILLHHLRMIDDGTKLKSNENTVFNSPSKSGNKEDAILNYINERINEKISENSKQGVVEYAINLSEKFRLSVEFISSELPKYDKKNPLIGDVLILDKGLSIEFFMLLFHLDKIDLLLYHLDKKDLLLYHLDKKDLWKDSELIRQWEKLLFTRDFHNEYYGKVYRDDFEGLFFKVLKEEVKTVLDKYVKEGFRENIDLPETVKKHIELNKSIILNNAFNWWNEKMVYILYKYEIAQKADLYMLRKIMKEGRSVEHILPQSWEWAWINEKDSNNISEKGKMTNDKIQSIINGLGNLLLITSSENSSVSNNHPKDKEYNSCKGGSYDEHKKENWEDYTKWQVIINDRGKKIFDFMKNFIQ